MDLQPTTVLASFINRVSTFSNADLIWNNALTGIAGSSICNTKGEGEREGREEGGRERRGREREGEREERGG